MWTLCPTTLTPSCVSCRGSRPLSGRWWKASWNHRAAWPPPRTCPDRRDPPQTGLALLASARGLHLRTLCQEQT